MLHHQKSSKIHTPFCIFAMSSFIKNTKKHVFLLQTFSAQNRHSYTWTEFCLDAILHSKKRSKKQQKLTLSRYIWVQKSMLKSWFFVYFLLEILCKNITKNVYKTRIWIQWIAKVMQKNSKIMYYLLRLHCKTLLFEQCFQRVLK